MNDVQSIIPPTSTPMTIKDRVRLATALTIAHIKPDHIPLSRMKLKALSFLTSSDYLALLRLTLESPKATTASSPYGPVSEGEVWQFAFMNIMSRVTELEKTNKELAERSDPVGRSEAVLDKRSKRSRSV